MLFRDVLDKAFNQFKRRNGFLHICIIFMSVIVKSNRFPIVIINAGSCDNRPSKVSSDVFGNNARSTFVRFCIDIETIFMIAVTGSFCFLEGVTDAPFRNETMTVLDVKYFEGHRGSAVDGIFCATGRTAVHGTTKGRVTTVNYTVDIFDDGLTWM